MFKFLKDKIKGAVSKLTKKVEEEGKEEVVEITKDEAKELVEKSKAVEPIKESAEPVSEPVNEPVEPIKEPIDEPVSEPVPVKEPVSEPLSEPRVEPAEPVPVVKPEPDKIIESVSEPTPIESKVTRDTKPKIEPKVIPKIIDTREDTVREDTVKEIHETAPKDKSDKKGFFKKFTEKITTKKIDEKQFNSLFWDLELVLLENNVAVEVIEKIKNDLKEELVDKPVPRTKVQDTILTTLQKSINELFIHSDLDLLKLSESKKPLVVCFVGINGSGKTTTIAKVAKMFLDNNKSVVLAAADTFRAAAIDQLQIHADNLGVKMIRHDYGADAAAVAFDAINHAKSKDKDIVLIDTAGRLHSNQNLVDEMKKIIRIAKPDVNIFVGESITGNDCIEQAVKFDDAIGLHGIILSKADIDEKGGAAISVSYVTKKPILYLGMGQEYSDLEKFESDKIVDKLFS
ncbi:signal recognition particle-docking protein FtsY [Nanoarchaeota archaeon]